MINPRALARACLSPAEMGTYMDESSYFRPGHVELMSRRIASMVREAATSPKPMGGRIIFEMPPRHGKSDLGSYRLPVWALERWPHLRVLHTSYEHSFSAEWGKKSRDWFEGNLGTMTTRVRKDKRAGDRWETTAGGGMTCSGVGGPLTGRGANVLIIDDPIKNRAEANSELIRDSLWKWFTSTAYTRLEPGGVCVIIMTRWHEDDLVGRLVADQPDVWERVRFPALAEEADSLGRSAGEPLWPARYDLEALASIKRTAGSADWASLYQQRPSPAGGAVFQKKYLQYATSHTNHFNLDGRQFLKTACRYFQTIDTAMKTGDENNYSVVMTFAVTAERDLIVVDVARGKIPISSQMSWVITQRAKWDSRPGWMYQACEDMASGVGLLAAAKQRGLPMKALKHGSRDKVARASTAAILSENGGLWLANSIPDIESLESEILVFPNGRHDDQVDCLSYGALLLGLRSSVRLFGSEDAPRQLSRKVAGLDGLSPTGGWGFG